MKPARSAIRGAAVSVDAAFLTSKASRRSPAPRSWSIGASPLRIELCEHRLGNLGRERLVLDCARQNNGADQLRQ